MGPRRRRLRRPLPGTGRAARILPRGTVLDGELVRLTPQGRAEFSAVLRRHQLVSPRKIHWAAQREPVAYMAFDLLQLRGECLLKEPLSVRRDLLEQLVGSIDGSPLRLSPSVTDCGKSLFDDAAAQGHEGIMAKRLDSRYQPGRRSPAWRKIKPREVTLCVIIGYRVGRGSSLTTLLLAAHHGGSVALRGRGALPAAARHGSLGGAVEETAKRAAAGAL